MNVLKDLSLLPKTSRPAGDYNPATPSAFAEWVFKNSEPGRRWMTGKDVRFEKAKRERLRLGSLNHAQIEELKLRLQNDFVRLNADYAVEFVDDGKTNFLASRLSYRGDAFICRPDLVLINKNGNHVIIVELKTTGYLNLHKINIIPSNGWLNWRIQLWCYSFIDKWADVDRITMVGEVWYDCRSIMVPSDKRFTLEKSDKKYEVEFLECLKKYRGKLRP